MPNPEKFESNGVELRAIVAPLLHWYGEEKRTLPWRRNTDPYRVWVSEIMLQQTRVDTVIPYYERFMERLPDIRSLAEIPEEELLKLWEGLGYYSRVRNLQKAARQIMAEYGGVFPGSYEGIVSLPGIGPYTAGAIASIALELPIPAVDGNVMRVLSRITENGSDIALPATRRAMTQALAGIYPQGRCGDFTQSLMELGAIVCLPNGAPLCGSCPLSGICRAYGDGTQLDYPVQSRKLKRRREKKTVLLLRYGERIAVRRRGEEGLLAGLWEFPCLDGGMESQAVHAWLTENGLEPVWVEKAATARHIFSHVEWEMTAYCALCGVAAPELEWVTREELRDRITLPTAFRKFYRWLEKNWT